jgi:uncharacterized protein
VKTKLLTGLGLVASLAVSAPAFAQSLWSVGGNMVRHSSAYVLRLTLATIAVSFFHPVFATVVYGQQPSFNCLTDSLYPDEGAICANSELSQLDRQMVTLYTAVREPLDAGRQILLRDAQRNWLRQRAACGPSMSCIATLYRKRIAELQTLIAGPPAAPPVTTASPSYPSKDQSRPVIDGTPSKQTSKRIPLRLSGNSYIVPVLINGRIWLPFVLDTGADNVSIPVDVAKTLMRTGTITKKDIGDEQSYRLADGGTVKGRQLRIRSLQIGEGDNAVVAQNVAGGTSGSQGSLLLGQSFLRQFRSTTIDHVNSVLIIDGSEPQPPVPTALQPAPAPVLQPAHPANAQQGPIPPPPVPRFVCNRPVGLPGVLMLGHEDAFFRGCVQGYNIRMQQWRAEMERVQMLNQQRGY